MPNRRGFTVLELLVCAAIMVVVLVALYWLAGYGGLFVASQRSSVEHFLEATEFFEFFQHDLRNVSRRVVEGLEGGRFRIRLCRSGESESLAVDYLFDPEGRSIERSHRGRKRSWRFPEDESFSARFLAAAGSSSSADGAGPSKAGSAGGATTKDLVAGLPRGAQGEEGAGKTEGGASPSRGLRDRLHREGSVQIILGKQAFRFPLHSSSEERLTLGEASERSALPELQIDDSGNGELGELASAVVPSSPLEKSGAGGKGLQARTADLDRADRVFEQFIAGGDEVLPRWADPRKLGGRYTIYQPNSNLVDPKNGEPPLMIGLLPGQEAAEGMPRAVIPGLAPGDDGAGSSMGGAAGAGVDGEGFRSPQSPLDPDARAADPWGGAADGAMGGVDPTSFGGTGPSMGDGFTFDGRSLEEVLNDRITGRFSPDEVKRLDTAFQDWADKVGIDPCDRDYIWGQLDDASDWYNDETAAATTDGDGSRLAEATEWAAFDSKSVADQLKDRAGDRGFTTDNLGTGLDAAADGVGMPVPQPLAEIPSTNTVSAISDAPVFGGGGTTELAPTGNSGSSFGSGFGNEGLGNGGMDMAPAAPVAPAAPMAPAAPVGEAASFE